MKQHEGLNRRSFLKAGTFVAASASFPAGLVAQGSGSVVIAIDPSDALVKERSVAWAVTYLTQTLQERGIAVRQVAKASGAETSGVVLTIASAQSAEAQRILKNASIAVVSVPEALALVSQKHTGKAAAILACGHDARGLVYAITDLADIAQNAANPVAALAAVETKAEQPANQVRSLTRLFCSEPEDKPWYNDREMWPKYFDMLVSQRFNRFNLAFGIGYDFIRRVTDGYFLFTYPFLLKVPGYNVRVPQLPDAERERNLEMLRYIGEQCVMRGMEFHVGLWMHGYEWIDSPNPNYTIEGLDKTSHGPYCRDAVRMLLQQVPNIQGLTFRIHGESGVEEGSFDFWKTVFDGVKTCGRRVPIDMHAKGMNQSMIDIALGTGQPVQITPKFWGEHMGMPYHQTDIRQEEKPKAVDQKGLMAMSSGTRAFLRYSYGDLLTEDRKWTVVHRIWPGTQRVLLWGDPLFAAGYSRIFSFCGTQGVEIQEMLSFKGRRGSGHAGDRCAYQDSTYKVRWDWQKYEYGTRVWGRMLYNPETNPQVFHRYMEKQFGAGAVAMQTALANVSRILPVVTTAYAPSAGNNSYWPELYINESMVDAAHYGSYGDSPRPRVFGTASPFDPELFYTVNAYTDDLLDGKSNGRYSPVDVAQWLETYASAGRKALAQADASAAGRGTGVYRRAKTDILIQVSIGEFFAAKLRSGALFRVFEKTQSRSALDAAIKEYQKARAAWADAAGVAQGVYMSDITLGEEPQLRGHWMDRLPAMDKDIAALSAMLGTATSSESTSAAAAMKAIMANTQRPVVATQHRAPVRFREGEALTLSIKVPAGITGARLHYRHVDQAENYQTLDMEMKGETFTAAIPASYTATKFPLEYFFEYSSSTFTTLYPGFAEGISNQPYFVVRSV